MGEGPSNTNDTLRAVRDEFRSRTGNAGYVPYGQGIKNYIARGLAVMGLAPTLTADVSDLTVQWMKYSDAMKKWKDTPTLAGFEGFLNDPVSWKVGYGYATVKPKTSAMWVEFLNRNGLGASK